MPYRWLRISLWVLGAFAPAAAVGAPLEPGEILVAHGAQILRVDPDTGEWSVFSPPPAGTNLMPFFTRSMVIDPAGTVFVTTSDYKLVAIDRETGEQSEVHEVDRFCLQQGCFLIDQGVLDVGSQPAGLAISSNRTRTHKPVLYVSSGNGLWEVSRTHTGAVSAEQVDGDGDVNSSSLALIEDAGGVVLMLLSKGLTIDAWNPLTGLTHEFADPAGLIASIDYRDGDLFFVTQDFGCSATAAGVWLGDDDPVELTWGGFLRCPNDIAIDPFVPLRLWIAERRGWLVRVQYDGVDWVQTLVADLEEAAGDSYHVAIAPEWVPEPGACASATACAGALAWLTRGRSAASRRRRSR
jgi:hypothetical protein